MVDPKRPRWFAIGLRRPCDRELGGPEGDAIDPADMQQAKHLVRKLRRGKSVWTATFIITGGLIGFGACSKGLGILAFIAAFILGGVIASVVSSVTSRPNRSEQAFLMRIETELHPG